MSPYPQRVVLEEVVAGEHTSVTKSKCRQGLVHVLLRFPLKKTSIDGQNHQVPVYLFT